MTALLHPLGRLGAVALLPIASCGGSGEQRVAVEPFAVQVAEDGMTVSVAVSWPVDGVEGCPPDLVGLDIEVIGDVANVAVFVSAADTGRSCQAECGELWQSVKLEEAVGGELRWEWPSDALIGCSPSRLR